MSQRRSDYPYIIAVVILWPTELAADYGVKRTSVYRSQYGYFLSLQISKYRHINNNNNNILY